MVSKYSILAFFAMAMYTSCIPSKEDCHKIPKIINLDLEKVMGYWHVQQVGSEEEASKKCLDYNATLEKTKNGTVMHIQPIHKGERKVGIVDAYLINNNNEFELQWPGVKSGKSTGGWLVSTDYKTWSLWYVCDSKRDTKGIFFLSTRVQYAKSDFFQNTQNALKAIGLTPAKLHLRALDRTEC